MFDAISSTPPWCLEDVPHCRPAATTSAANSPLCRQPAHTRCPTTLTFATHSIVVHKVVLKSDDVGVPQMGKQLDFLGYLRSSEEVRQSRRQRSVVGCCTASASQRGEASDQPLSGSHLKPLFRRQFKQRHVEPLHDQQVIVALPSHQAHQGVCTAPQCANVFVLLHVQQPEFSWPASAASRASKHLLLSSSNGEQQHHRVPSCSIISSINDSPLTRTSSWPLQAMRKCR